MKSIQAQMGPGINPVAPITPPATPTAPALRCALRLAPPPAASLGVVLPQTEIQKKWIEYLLEKSPALASVADAVQKWVYRGTTPWDEAGGDQTKFVDFQRLHQNEFDGWNKQQQQSVGSTELKRYDKRGRLKTMQDVQNVVKQLRDRGFTDQMIAKFNPNIYRAMQEYGLGGGEYYNPQQMGQMQQQYYTQTQKPSRWSRMKDWMSRNFGGAGRAEKEYQQQYAKSSRPILTAYAGSAIRKLVEADS